MATYQSLQTAVSDNIGTVTITKPTSLAVGDKMFAGITVDADGGGTQLASITTPAGWTQEALLDLFAVGRSALGVYSKTADSADVAASNFTFTGTGDTGSMTMAGIIARVTNWGGEAGQTSATSVAASTTLTMTGITPSPVEASSLYLVFATRISSTPLSVSVSSVAIATSDPTWTERTEISGDGNSRDTTLALYTATRVETTATGNYTVTFNNTTNQGCGAVGLILHSPISGSVTPVTEVATYAFSPISKTQINAVAEDPATQTYKVADWQNEAENPVTWVNEPL